MCPQASISAGARRVIVLLVGLASLSPISSYGQLSEQRLKSFSFINQSGARSQAPLIIGADGTLYGTTLVGGTGRGTVFKVNTNGTGYTVLHSFGPNGSDGESPYSALMQGRDGALYGTTRGGGTNPITGWNGGAVFKLNPDGTGYTVLHSFYTGPFSGQDRSPSAALVQGGDGTLYGTAGYPDKLAEGVVFKLNEDGNGYTVLASSANSVCFLNDFRNPLVRDGDGTLYGTTVGGSCGPGIGTVFRLISGSTSLEVLHNFQIGGEDGFTPAAGLLLGSDGLLYGTTPTGGSANVGTIFKLNRDGTGYRVLFHFLTTGGIGQRPYGALIQGIDGRLYGTTAFGGSAGVGTVFRINTNGTEHVVLYSFGASGDDGQNPSTALVQGGDGTLYGTTQAGGRSGQGTIFRLNTEGAAYTALWHFSVTGGDGQFPYSAVVQGNDGALYGTTSGGGSVNRGTVFKVGADGSGYLVLHNFGPNAGDGAHPYSALVQGTDGALYGTTSGGGASNVGTVFKLSASGAEYAVLHSFGERSDDGRTPYAPLVQGGDGVLYGTTSSGGSNGVGAVFKLNPNGMGYSVLYSFSSGGGDGRFPYAGLVQGSDGALYGTTPFGGSNGVGTVFKVNPDGTAYAVLHSFSESGGDAPNPYAALIQGEDGALYGTARGGGPYTDAYGVVFKLSPDGTGYTVLHSFGSVVGDGWYPHAALIKGSDGALYGTTQCGGSSASDPCCVSRSGYGAVFKINTNGAGYEVVHSFSELSGSGQYPYAPLALGSDGALYGTTAYGGEANSGTVFRLGNAAARPFIVVQPCSLTNAAGTVASFAAVANGVAQLNYQWQKSGANLIDGGNVVGATTTNLSLSNITAQDTGEYRLVVTSAMGSATSAVATLTVVVPPQFTSTTLLPDGTIQASFDAMANLKWRIEASTNLVDWEGVTHVSLSNAPARFTDADAMNFRQRFYRILWTP